MRIGKTGVRITYMKMQGKLYAKATGLSGIPGQCNLGRVIHKGVHIFKSRERGLVQLDPETGALNPIPEENLIDILLEAPEDAEAQEYVASLYSGPKRGRKKKVPGAESAAAAANPAPTPSSASDLALDSEAAQQPAEGDYGDWVNPDLDWEDDEPDRRRTLPVRQVLGIGFGDVYALDRYLERAGLYQVLSSWKGTGEQTLKALLAYYILSWEPNACASDWQDRTYAGYLWPRARLDAVSVLGTLAEVGRAEKAIRFFQAYLETLKTLKTELTRKDPSLQNCVLLDMAGIPDGRKLPVTAISGADGTVSQQVRLLAAVQRDTGMPLYLDGSAQQVLPPAQWNAALTVLNSVQAKVTWAVLQNALGEPETAQVCTQAGISWLSGVSSAETSFRKEAQKHLSELDSPRNYTNCGSRMYSVVSFPWTHKGTSLWGYLAADTSARYASGTDASASSDPLDGVLLLVSSAQLPADQVLPLYFLPDRIRLALRIEEKTDRLQPPAYQGEDTFRGHLLFTFLAAAVHTLLEDCFQNSGQTADHALWLLQTLQASVYPELLVVNQATALVQQAFRTLRVAVPESAPNFRNAGR